MSGTFRCLTLDVGITTGYAVASYDAVLEHGTIDALVLRESLLQLVRDYQPITDVVAEGTIPGRSRLQKRLAQCESTIKKLFPEAAWITAGNWKITPAARIKVPRGITQHERDAIRIWHWYRYGPWEENVRSRRIREGAIARAQ